MSLDLTKLENVDRKPDGSVVARCPACAKKGGDQTNKNHLKIYPDGSFSCAANQGDKAHNREILTLAGSQLERARAKPDRQEIRFKIKPFRVAPSAVIANLGRFGRQNQSASGSMVDLVQAETPDEVAIKSNGGVVSVDEESAVLV